MRFRVITLACLVAAVVLVASGVLSAAPQAVHAQTPADSSRKITVNGAGTVYASPDVGYLSVGVDVQNEELAVAMKDANSKMDAVLAALKKAEIADNDIQTVQYNIYREGQASGSAQSPAYHVVDVVRVTVRTIANVGDVLDAAVKAGANVVNNIEFGVKDTKTSETEARKAALADAKSRATELATSVGGTLGQVLTIQETGGFGPVTMPSEAVRGMGGGGPSIMGGSLQVTINLIVTYELK